MLKYKFALQEIAYFKERINIFINISLDNMR